MPYRLGLDVGSTSLGWWVWEEDKDGEVIRAIDGGVRIYSDGRIPKTGTSLASARRVARGARRRRDRYLKRRERLLDQLIGLGLMPTDECSRKRLELQDPYLLRARALDFPLAPYELGRALFHLNQRRGFKSNRIAEGGSDEKESGQIRSGIKALDLEFERSGCRTIGEYLYQRTRSKKPTRFRPGTEIYPSRMHYEEEFDRIRDVQSKFHELNIPDWDNLKRIIFHQRPLKPVDPGRCTLLPDEDRAPLALPISQLFRIHQEASNLTVIQLGERDRWLSSEERQSTIDLLLAQKTVSFNALRKKLGLRLDSEFNLESERRKQLDGDKTAAILSKVEYFGKSWRTKNFNFRTDIVRTLTEKEDESEILTIAQGIWGLNPEVAERITSIRLPQGFARLSERAMNALVPLMAKGCQYHEAVEEAFPHLSHSEVDSHVHVQELPYYPELLERHVSRGTNNPDDDVFKQLGRISNPTVHVGLNQLRRVVNAIVGKYGPPRRIVVELTRDLKSSKERKDETKRRQTLEQEKNERRREDLENCGVEPNSDYLRQIRLWEEQGPPQARCCPYCGKTISFEMVLDARTQVDHILPFSRTLDDSLANKVVCCQPCNQLKRNRTPAEAFGHNTSGKHDYTKMLERANTTLPSNKKWRFEHEAMDRYEEEEGFLDRQLNDTSYLARIAKTYLQNLCETPAHVSVTPGRLTSLLRGKWGLNNILADSNFKNRTDHRHHAVDAAVIALIDRELLRRVSTAAGRGTEGHRLIANVPEPIYCPDFRDQIRRRVLDELVVVHRPKHINTLGTNATSGQLHNDSAHGIVEGPDQREGYTVARRVALRDLKPKVLTGKDRRQIVDEGLRKRLLAMWEQFLAQGKKWSEFCDHVAQRGRITSGGVRRVRCHEAMVAPVVISDRNGKPYKVYKADSNAYMEIFRTAHGKYQGETIRTYDANQRASMPKWRSQHQHADKVMRLHVNDLVALGEGSSREILRIVKLSKQRITCAHVHEGGALKSRDADPNDPFNYVSGAVSTLMKEGLRRIGVDDLGQIHDSGPIPT